MGVHMQTSKLRSRVDKSSVFTVLRGSQNSLFLVSFLAPSQDTCFFHAWPPRGATLGSQRTFPAHLGILPSGRSGVHSCWLELDFHGLASQKESQMYPFDNFSYMSEVPKQQLPSQILSPLIYLKLLWECMQSTLHTNASCSRNLWTVRLKHNVTFNMIGIPCDTWVVVGSISVGKVKHPQVISRQSSMYAYSWPGILQRELRY